MKFRTQTGSVRLIPSAFLAMGIVFGLLFLMQALINANLTEPEENESIQIADIWQEDTEVKDEIKQRKVEEIETPDAAPPEIPKQNIEIAENTNSLTLTAPKLEVAKVDIGGGFSDGDIIPLVAVQPNYPQRAAERGIEGYAVVSFVIQRDGTTRDHEIVESTSSLFNSASIRAAERLKYKPRIIDGVPVEVDHLYKFTYELED